MPCFCVAFLLGLYLNWWLSYSAINLLLYINLYHRLFMKNPKKLLLYILLPLQVLAVLPLTSCRTTETSNDLDGDGVVEADDICPDTPRDVKVDDKGCPLDEDNDGVPDYQDTKPEDGGTTATIGEPRHLSTFSYSAVNLAT